MKKRGFLVLVVLVCLYSSLSFAAGKQEVASDTGTSGVRTGGTLTIAAKDDWSTFDPYFQISISNRLYNPMLFDTLIKTGDGIYEPGLATSWDFNDDLTEITFHLRKGVKFQDGSDFDADDVVWNVNRAIDFDAGYHVSDYFKDCVGAEAIDPYTVKVTWAATSHLIEDAFSRLYLICPEKVADVAKLPIGTGPFKLKEWKPGDKAVFSRNGGYWKDGMPYLDEVVIRTISDGQSRVVNLLSGEVDIIDAVDPQDVSVILKNKNMGIFQNTPPEYKNFTMNVTRAPFDDLKVRQALNHALDRDKVFTMVNSGQGDIRYLPIVSNSYFYEPELENYYPFDLEKAKALLVEAGYPNGFSFTLTVNMGIAGCLEQAQVYQADLAKIGVNATLEPLESASYFPRLTSSDFDMVSFGTGEPILDPAAYFSGASVARPMRNFFGITEDTEWFPGYKALIEQAESETNQSVRKELYRQLLSIMVHQGWTMPVTSTVTKVAANNAVRDFDINNTAGEYHLEDVWVSR